MSELNDEILKNAHVAHENFNKQLAEMVKKGGPSGDFASASLFAKNSIRENELQANLSSDGEWFYTREQVSKAAIHAREDVVAIFALQKIQLERMDTIKKLLWACIVLLVIIASKLS
jgi:hypothetical protein